MLVLLLGAGDVWAHKLNTSYANLVARTDTLMLRVRIDDFDMEQMGLDTDGDGALYYEEMEAGLPQIADFISAHLRVDVNGRRVSFERGTTDISPDNKGNIFAVVYLGAHLPEPPEQVDIDVDFFSTFGDEHKCIAKVLLPGKSLEQAVFAADTQRQSFYAHREKSLLEQARAFIWLGVEHIFLGYDHIMFLLALIIVGGRLRDLVKIVSAFTIAHSITLCLAALEYVHLPARWIEAGIALSIVYVALENFWLKRTDHRWMLTFAFGLVHGFGFANVLRELGLPTKGLVVSLLSFNIGVEFGQIAIVALLFPLILWLNRQAFQRSVVWGLSAVILLFGTGWFVERIFDLKYMPI
jgi:hydrogenase/urease accessory protein HupE